MSTLSHHQGDRANDPMLITAFIQILTGSSLGASQQGWALKASRANTEV